MLDSFKLTRPLAPHKGATLPLCEVSSHPNPQQPLSGVRAVVFPMRVHVAVHPHVRKGVERVAERAVYLRMVNIGKSQHVYGREGAFRVSVIVSKQDHRVPLKGCEQSPGVSRIFDTLSSELI